MAENDRADQEAPDTVTIKKYANRRLYNTATSSYVTLDNLCDMVRNGEDFVVRDARSGGDITRQGAHPRSSSSRRPRGRICSRSASFGS